jgi:D-3-phosphoglycerate dehydrogenase
LALKTIASFAQLDTITLSQDEFAARSVNYEALMVRLQLRVTGEMITNSPNLKAIFSPTTGLDHIDVHVARSCNVAVFSLQGENAFLRTVHSTAEHTFALLLSLIRNIPSAVEAVKQNRWEPYRHRGYELKGRTLGIIGCGRLGIMVAKFGHAFGMHVLGYDPYIKRFPKSVRRCATLDALLHESEILSIHVPLNETTMRMIDARELALLPRGAFLVNTSRGAVVDEHALIDSLEQEHLAGAAVDVLTDEHLIVTTGHPLIEHAKTHSNLLITPHIAGDTWEAVEKTDMFVIDKFRRWLAKQKSVREGGSEK